MTPPPEHRDSLWWLTVGPGIWAVHFLASYATVAVWCAKVAGRDGALGTARTLVFVYTVVALLGIGAVAVRGWRRHSYGTATEPHDFDTPEDRHRFLGFSSLLLSLLSAIAVLYAGLTVAFIASCR